MNPLIVSIPSAAQLEAGVLADVVQPRVAADEQTAFVERLYIEVLAAGRAWRRRRLLR